jgi:hypothetical protein
LPRRIPILALAALVLLPASAMAAPGVNLYVGDCSAGATANSVTEACTTNAGTSFSLVGSIVLPAVTIDHFAGCESILDIQTDGPSPIPDWWRADACRPSGFLATADPVVIGGSCATIWDAVPASGTSLNAVFPDETMSWRLRFLIDSPIDAGAAAGATLTGDAATERSVFRLTVTRIASTGLGRCAGCPQPACLVLNEINLRSLGQAPSDWLRVTDEATNRHISFNGDLLTGVCPDAVPVHNRTWGSIKAMYR